MKRSDAGRARGAEAAVLLAVGLCLASSACGYRLRGTGSFLPPHIKSVSVPLFKNQTTRYELDLKLTQAVINEFVARGKVEVASDLPDPDAILEGEVTGFGVSPIGFSGSDKSTADRYAVTIAASVTLRDVRTNRVIFSNPAYVYQTEYQVPPGTDFESSETEALGKVAELFARTLVITILEGF